MILSLIATLIVIGLIVFYIGYERSGMASAMMSNAVLEVWRSHFDKTPETLFFDPASVFEDVAVSGLFHVAHVIWAENLVQNDALSTINPDDALHILSKQSRYHCHRDHRLKKYDCIIIASMESTQRLSIEDIQGLLHGKGVVINLSDIEYDELLRSDLVYYQFDAEELL